MQGLVLDEGTGEHPLSQESHKAIQNWHNYSEPTMVEIQVTG